MSTVEAPASHLPLPMQNILSRLAANSTEAEQALVRKAYAYAAAAHAGQVRLSGEPYLSHPLAVAEVLAELGFDAHSVAAGLLHDTVEDTKVTLEEVDAEFGEQVADIVDGVTKISMMTFDSKEEQQAENIRKMILAMSHDIRVPIVKLADRVHNMRTLDFQKAHKRQRIAQETMDIYVPLANRLGLHRLKLELEGLSFKYIHPDVYAQISDWLESNQVVERQLIAKIIAKLEGILSSNQIEGTVWGRIKHIYSIYKKMTEQNLTLDDMHDILAFRVIVKDVRDCYAVLGLVHAQWKPVPGRFKDYISMPKANGYEALHSTVMGPDGVWVEVQIRTQRMEDIAERGFAAHWKYKHATISQDEDEFDKWLKQIRSALNSPTENAVDFLDNFKLSLYTSEIVVFTPKGEARKMPFGATALDFAYDIHSKIGNSAISAKINHKLEPITTQINSGDQIEIITADNARPKPEWLEIVTTAKAKQSIKSFLKRERQNNIERGMHMLDEKMKSLNIKLSGRVLRKIVPIYESNNKEELYSKIGAGIVNLDNLEKVLKVNSKSKILKFWTLFINKKEEEDGDDATAPGETAPEKEPAAEPQFEIAECCKPIPGDKVVGYRDPATGNIIVHKANCDELDRLAAQFGKNIVKDEIKWSQHKAMSYLVTIELRGIDRMGILLDLAKVVSGDFSINIREVSIHSHDGIFEGSISLYVKDAEGLHDVMDKLRKIKGIESVKRTLS